MTSQKDLPTSRCDVPGQAYMYDKSYKVPGMTTQTPASPAAGNRPCGRRTKDMPDGRQALLRAATLAFSKNGFDGAEIRGIAASAGVSPNLVRVHFGSKADLWEACLGLIVSATKPTMDEVARLAKEVERPLYDRLRDIIVRVSAFYAAHPEVRDFVNRHGSDAPERAALVTERILRPAYESSRELFAAGIEAGIIRSSHPALFFALLMGAVSQPPVFPTLLNLLAPDIPLGEARTRMAETMVASLLHRPA